MTTFAIRLDWIWRIPFLLITATPGRAYVALDDETITFRLGWFEEVLPPPITEADWGVERAATRGLDLQAVL